MTQVQGSIKIERIPGDCRFVRMLEPFSFYSDILGRWCTIPAGFIYDEESVPFIRGTNPEAGAVHDYLCRKDSDPVVTGWVAAKVYLEIQRYFDEQETGWLNGAWDVVRRNFKTLVVVTARVTYFHKFPVAATYEQITGHSEPPPR